MQGFQQPGAPPMNPYSAPPPGMPAGPSGLGGQPPGSYLQGPYGQQLQQPAAPAIPGVQSTSLYLGFEAAPDFNVAQRLKGPSECYQPVSAFEAHIVFEASKGTSSGHRFKHPGSFPGCCK